MNSSEFKVKVLPFSSRIYPMAARILGNETDACDAVQEIMIKLWNKRKQLTNHPNIAGFVFLTARNYCLDLIRSRNTSKADPIDQGKIVDLYVDHRDNEFEELSRLVQEVITVLPENQKEIILLHDIDGLEFEEIVTITNLRIEHIRVLLSRARKHVRLELEKIYSYEQRRIR